MAEVHHRSRGGKGPDPFTARRALRRFVKAAIALDAAWHPALEVPTWPRSLPPFDELLRDLQNWQEEVEDRPYGEQDERPALDLADREAVRAWVADLRTQILDVTAAGEDALLPLSQRSLGRRAARRAHQEASHAVEQLLAAADRGLAPPAS